MEHLKSACNADAQSGADFLNLSAYDKNSSKTG